MEPWTLIHFIQESDPKLPDPKLPLTPSSKEECTQFRIKANSYFFAFCFYRLHH